MSDDLISKITAPATKSPDKTENPPAPTPAPATPVAIAVQETDLLSGETAPETLVVGEETLLTGEQTALPLPPSVAGLGEAPKKRGRGRPRKTPSEPAPSDPPLESPSQVPNIADLQAVAELATVDYKLMSEATFDMTTGILATTLGPEWQAKTPEEREMVCGPLAIYFKSKQMTDLPPGLMLTIVVCAYSAPRLREPSTAGKLRLTWQWLKEKFRRRNRQQIAV